MTGKEIGVEGRALTDPSCSTLTCGVELLEGDDSFVPFNIGFESMLASVLREG